MSEEGGALRKSPGPGANDDRSRLDARRHGSVGEDWAGGLPAQYGTAPHVRIGRRWLNALWLLPPTFGLVVSGVALARAARETEAVRDFIARYPGTVPTPAAPVGVPGWLAWQHFLNLFFMLFIFRSGLTILADHPRLYWNRHSTPGSEWLRFHRAVPDDPTYTAKADSLTLPDTLGLPGRRHSIGLARWWHLGLDMLWLANGLVFYALLFATGQWMRIVPRDLELVPHSASLMLQYLSLDWPEENGWHGYNSLQVVAYFVTVFVAAPGAMLTGLGMSPALSTRFNWLNRLLSAQVARSLHFLVLCWYAFFLVVHVTLVFATGAVRNLNHIYAAQDAESWVGVVVFLGSALVLVVAWLCATPFTYRHPRIVQQVGAALIGPMEALFEHVDSRPGKYTERDISPFLWANGRVPDSEEYAALRGGEFADYRLRIYGQVEHPTNLSLAELRALPFHEQITQHFCIQGWSGIAKWGGVSMSSILGLVRPLPTAKWVVFYSFAPGSDGGTYYDVQPVEQMRYHLTMLAFEMNGAPLPFRHGAPLRLRNEAQLGFKMVKWIAAIEFVADFRDIGGGFGGYNNDHEFFGYRQAI